MLRERIICVGNELCHDDGVASAVAIALEARSELQSRVEIVRIAEFGLSSLDAFLDVDHVIVVDAVSTGGTPGTCEVLAAPLFSPSPTCSIGHAISLTSMLELVAQLQPGTPAPRLTVIGIEAQNLSPFGTTLSPAVRDAIPRAVELVLGALSN